MPGPGRPFEVGNPGGPGRPPAGRTFRDLYMKYLEEMQVGGMSAKDALVKLRIGRALKGSKQDQDAIENRVDGSPAESIQFLGNGELNIHFVPMTFEELATMENVRMLINKEPEDGQRPEALGPDGPGAGSTGT